jgi:hypothetical protein
VHVSIEKRKFAYRMLEPSEERAQGGSIASDQATSDTSSRVGCDRTEDAALIKGVEESVVGTATRENASDGNRSKEEREKRAEHPGEREEARETREVAYLGLGWLCMEEETASYI